MSSKKRRGNRFRFDSTEVKVKICRIFSFLCFLGVPRVGNREQVPFDDSRKSPENTATPEKQTTLECSEAAKIFLPFGDYEFAHEVSL